MMHKIHEIGLALVCFLLASCGGRGPQRPSHRSGQHGAEDSTAIAVMVMNQRLAIAADDAVLRYVSGREDVTHFAQLPFSNAWQKIVEIGEEDGETPKQDEVWTLHIKTYSMDRKLLIDSEQEYRIGRGELPMCIELIINEWHHGTKVEMAVPWYSAYGMTGTAEVGAYENVVMEIEVR